MTNSSVQNTGHGKASKEWTPRHQIGKVARRSKDWNRTLKLALDSWWSLANKFSTETRIEKEGENNSKRISQEICLDTIILIPLAGKLIHWLVVPMFLLPPRGRLSRKRKEEEEKACKCDEDPPRRRWVYYQIMSRNLLFHRAQFLLIFKARNAFVLQIEQYF